jgi:peptidyl-prolyl cis-trans isomerase A (cyclophilin A)
MKLKMSAILATVVIFTAGTVVLAQGGASVQKTAPTSKPPAGAAGPFDKALLTPSALTAKAPAEFDVKFTTNVGDFTVHVTRAWAPNGADRFYNLVKHHFYDGAGFYRAIAGFMAQWGISAIPEVDRVWENATIKDDPVRRSNTRGMITYAQTPEVNSRSTQLFINYIDNSRLDKDRFAPFGEVTSGMDVVDKINSSYQNLDPDKISKGGKAYLEKNFPNMTFIKTTTLIAPEPAAATPKP